MVIYSRIFYRKGYNMLLFIEMLTLDLKKSNNQDVIQGKLILNISTNVNAPIRNGTNTLTPTTRTPAATQNTTPVDNTPTQNNASAGTTAPPSISSSRPEDDSRNHDLPEG